MSHTTEHDAMAPGHPTTSLEALAAQQGVRPLKDLRELVGTFWPEDESTDEFVQGVRRLRRTGETRVIP